MHAPRTFAALALLGLSADAGAAVCDGAFTDAERIDCLREEVDLLRSDLDLLEAEHSARLDDLERFKDIIQPLLNDIAGGQASINIRLAGLEDASSEGVVRLIAEDTTYAVGDEGALRDALAALDGYRIAAHARVTLQLDDSTYTFDEPLSIRHPDGANIHLVGDEADPRLVTLNFPDSDGVVVADGYDLGLISGVTIQGASVEGTRGVAVTGGASAALGYVEVSAFGTGVSVETGGLLRPAAAIVAAGYPAGWLSVSDCVEGGVSASWGALAQLPGATSEVHGGAAFFAEWGAALDVAAATASWSEQGFSARDNATLRADEAWAVDNRADGVSAAHGAYSSAVDAAISGSSDGLSAWGMGRLMARGATVSSCDVAMRSHWASSLYFEAGESSDNGASFHQWGNGYIGAPASSLADDAEFAASGANDADDFCYH